MHDTLLAYDLGTGGNKASLYDARGGLLATAFVPYDTQYPQAGWHEQRPADWWDSVVRSTRQLLASGAARPESIAAWQSPGTAWAACRSMPEAVCCVSQRRSGPTSGRSPRAARFFATMDPVRWYRLTGMASLRRTTRSSKFSGTATASRRCSGESTRWWARRTMSTSAHGPAGDRLLLRVGERRVRSVAVEILGRTASRRRASTLLAAGDRAVDEILGTLTSEAAEALGLRVGIPVACGGVDNSVHGLGGTKPGRGKHLCLARLIDVDRRLVGKPAAGGSRQALRVHPCDPGDVQLGGGHLFRGIVAPLGARPSLPGSHD